MLHITLAEIQEALPEYHVYAWRWTYHPELETYRAIAWMNIPLGEHAKIRYDRYIPQGLAPNKEAVVRLFHRSLEEALISSVPRGLYKA